MAAGVVEPTEGRVDFYDPLDGSLQTSIAVPPIVQPFSLHNWNCANIFNRYYTEVVGLVNRNQGAGGAIDVVPAVMDLATGSVRNLVEPSDNSGFERQPHIVFSDPQFSPVGGRVFAFRSHPSPADRATITDLWDVDLDQKVGLASDFYHRFTFKIGGQDPVPVLNSEGTICEDKQAVAEGSNYSFTAGRRDESGGPTVATVGHRRDNLREAHLFVIQGNDVTDLGALPPVGEEETLVGVVGYRG